MPELERTLRELVAATRYPATPDVAAHVVAAIPQRRQRRLVVVALAAMVVVIAMAIAFAVPPARSAILDWLGFGPIRIEHVSTLPPVPDAARLALGCAATLAEARRAMGFRILKLPREADGIFVDKPDGEVTLLYGRLLLGEIRGHGFRRAEGRRPGDACRGGQGRRSTRSLAGRQTVPLRLSRPSRRVPDGSRPTSREYAPVGARDAGPAPGGGRIETEALRLAASVS